MYRLLTLVLHWFRLRDRTLAVRLRHLGIPFLVRVFSLPPGEGRKQFLTSPNEKGAYLGRSQSSVRHQHVLSSWHPTLLEQGYEVIKVVVLSIKH
jgi:hypothetical protein